MAAPKRATPAQIINHLRKAEVELAAPFVPTIGETDLK